MRFSRFYRLRHSKGSNPTETFQTRNDSNWLRRLGFWKWSKCTQHLKTRSSNGGNNLGVNTILAYNMGVEKLNSKMKKWWKMKKNRGEWLLLVSSKNSAGGSYITCHRLGSLTSDLSVSNWFRRSPAIRRGARRAVALWRPVATPASGV